MTITLKKCLSEKNHLTRKFDTSEGATLTLANGTLRDMSSIMDPIIRVPGTADIAGFNYLEIPSFGRKYNITDSPVLVTGMWEIHAHVDVIGTWLDEIKACPALVNERKQCTDLFVDDGHAFTDVREINQYIPFSLPGGHQADTNGHTCFHPNEWHAVLVSQGPGSDQPDSAFTSVTKELDAIRQAITQI